MNSALAESAGIASLIVSIITLLTVFYYSVVKLATLQVKVDTMWEFTMRRGKSEAVMSGLATINSPIRLKPEAWDVIANLVGPLQEFYDKLPNSKKMNDNELGLEIEQAFGERLLHEICIPHNLSMGACLLIAVAVAKDRKAKNCEPGTHDGQ